MDKSEVGKAHKPKITMTEKQKAARIANLANGRKKRMEMIKQKKERKSEEYDISSNDGSLDESESSSDSDDAFVTSKAKKRSGKTDAMLEMLKKDERPVKEHKLKNLNDGLKGEVDELKNMIIELANMQKKQHKTARKSRPSGGTKIVVLPQNTSGGSQSKAADDYMEKLRKSIFDSTIVLWIIIQTNIINGKSNHSCNREW